MIRIYENVIFIHNNVSFQFFLSIETEIKNFKNEKAKSINNTTNNVMIMVITILCKYRSGNKLI